MASNIPREETDWNEIIFPKVCIPEGGYFPDGNLGVVLEEIMKNGLEITREQKLIWEFLDNIVQTTLENAVYWIKPKPVIDPDLLQRWLQGLLWDIRKELEEEISISVIEWQEEIFNSHLRRVCDTLNVFAKIEAKIDQYLPDLIEYSKEK